MDIPAALLKFKKLGLTQTEIGDEIGCSQEAISQMARGIIGKTRPSSNVVDGLRLLAKKHGLTLTQSKRGPQIRRSTTKPR
jgi:transcriptional regulator with XRE-family HTH domain